VSGGEADETPILVHGKGLAGGAVFVEVSIFACMAFDKPSLALLAFVLTHDHMAIDSWRLQQLYLELFDAPLRRGLRGAGSRFAEGVSVQKSLV
jgi:hypothetical protein